MEYVYLQGSESVKNAAQDMVRAAEMMQAAIRDLEGLLFRFEQVLREDREQRREFR